MAISDYLICLRRLVDATGPAATARRLRVNEKTIRRWLTQQTRPYAYLVRLIELETAAAFGSLPGEWSGWEVRADGLLYAGDLKRGFTRGDLYGLELLQQRLRALQAENRQLAALIVRLQEQPAPGGAVPVFNPISLP